MSKQTGRLISLWFTSILVIAGCIPISTGNQPLATTDPSTIDSIIAQTAAAAQTQTATAQPTVTASFTATNTLELTPTSTSTATTTPTPTETIIFLFFTDTPQPVISLSQIGGGTPGLGTGTTDASDSASNANATKTPIPREWACSLVSKSPTNDTIITQGTPFKATWTVTNTGTKTWPKKGVDVVFYTGARMHDKPYFDIPKTVSPGESVTIGLTLTALNKRDTITTRWSLKVGRTFFCPLVITFQTR